LLPSAVYAQKVQNTYKKVIFKQAKQNIEKYRKDNFSIQIEGIKKKDLRNIQIEVEQTSHEFLFGCIFFDLVTPKENPENMEEFKTLFKNLFNFAVFPFYWTGYEWSPGYTKQKEIMDVVNWCNENGITTKGHPFSLDS
ncbi:MAG TPA: hypothetical protein VLA03_08515, partial [Draconibacterium sp.]|nr:hypothetical protein [Draconibacterium sp.]